MAAVISNCRHRKLMIEEWELSTIMILMLNLMSVRMVIFGMLRIAKRSLTLKRYVVVVAYLASGSALKCNIYFLSEGKEIVTLLHHDFTFLSIFVFYYCFQKLITSFFWYLLLNFRVEEFHFKPSSTKRIVDTVSVKNASPIKAHGHKNYKTGVLDSKRNNDWSRGKGWNHANLSGMWH